MTTHTFEKTALKAAYHGENFKQVYSSLVEQIKSKKSKTWRETKDEEFNVKDLPKLADSATRKDTK